MKLVYLIGAPGVGKTTLMTALTAKCERQSELRPFAHDWLIRETTPVAIELGRRRDVFSGTDALSMSVQPKAVDWISQDRPSRPPLILAEGARLATYGFLTAARNAGYGLALMHLCATEEELQRRRGARGSKQNATWMRGATTRAKRLFDQMAMDADRFLLAAHNPVEALMETAIGCVPELKVLTDD